MSVAANTSQLNAELQFTCYLSLHMGTELQTTIPSNGNTTKVTYEYETMARLGIAGTCGMATPIVGHVIEQRDVGVNRCTIRKRA